MNLHQLNDTIPTSILGVPMHLQILMNQAPVSSLVFGFAICYYTIGYRGDSNHLNLDHFRSPFPSISFGSFLTPLDEHKWTLFSTHRTAHPRKKLRKRRWSCSALRQRSGNAHHLWARHDRARETASDVAWCWRWWGDSMVLYGFMVVK